MMDCREYYLQQSEITDPGERAALLDDVPNDIEGLCSTVRGLVIHHLRGPKVFGWSIPQARTGELNTCYVSKMLGRLVELDDRPLKEPRPPERRLVGCCRDFAVLFCALARHKGIPARTRFGFLPSPRDGFSYAHVVAEYWDFAQRRWMLIDPELRDQEGVVAASATGSRDICGARFISGSRAWLECRAGNADPLSFGRAPGRQPSGALAIAQSLLQDVAALNKREPLLWSARGPRDEQAEEIEPALLDRAARLGEAIGDDFSQLQEIYQALPKPGSPPRRRIGGAPALVASAGQGRRRASLLATAGSARGGLRRPFESGAAKKGEPTSSSGLREEQTRRRGG